MKLAEIFDWLPGLRKRRILSMREAESRFTQIFHTNYWGDRESKSGFGSSLKATETIRTKLPEIFKQYQIKIVFDAPCGDFNWMQQVIGNTSTRYIGGDIVEPLVVENEARFASNNITFQKFDITKNSFPKADIWLCRHCLFHLSYDHIASALSLFMSSDIPLLATTSHIPTSKKIINSNIVTGDFRLIDLFDEPFNFPRNHLFACDDYISPDPPMGLFLWSRDQLLKPIEAFLTLTNRHNTHRHVGLPLGGPP